MNRSRLGQIIWSVVFLGIILSSFVIYQRFSVEQTAKTVEISVLNEDVKKYAKEHGIDFGQALEEFKAKGVTTVLLKEMTIHEFSEEHDLQVYSGGEILSVSRLGNSYLWAQALVKDANFLPDYTYIVTGDYELYKQVSLHAQVKIPLVSSFQFDNVYVIKVPYNNGKLQMVGFGVDQQELAEVEGKGLATIVQIRSWPDHPSLDYQKAMEVTVRPFVEDENISAIMFNDNMVPGAGGHLKELKQILLDSNKPIVTVEFFPQGGLSTLAKKLQIETGKNRLVRLHSISNAQMTKYIPNTAIDRYELAVTDRNITILLVKLFDEINGKQVDNLAFISDLANAIKNAGYTLGKAGLLANPQVPNLFIMIIGLSVIAGGLLVFRLWGLSEGLTLVFGVLSALVWLVSIFLGIKTVLLTKLLALASTIVFPTLAVSMLIKNSARSKAEAVSAFIKCVLTSFIGAVLMVGLLSRVEFMVKLDQFSGVVAAHVVPLVLVSGYILFKFKGQQTVKGKINEWLNQPVTIGLSMLAGVLVGALVVYVMRTGNEAQQLVSPLELKLRYLLQDLLIARPRTKEFLLGHPILIWLLYKGYQSNYYLPALLLAVIGQVSMVNTFAHLHTPIMVSLIRMGNGLWLGLIFGLVLICIDVVGTKLYKKVMA